jgi:hypothetical protein
VGEHAKLHRPDVHGVQDRLVGSQSVSAVAIDRVWALAAGSVVWSINR